MESIMRKIRFFRQHSNETCGISCVLMILYAFGKLQYPTVKQEEKLYKRYYCRALGMGTMASAAARCLSKNQLDVAIYHSSSDYLDNRDQYFPETIFQSMLAEYKEDLQSISDRVHTETNFAITADWYREQLDQGKLLMIECMIPGDVDGRHREQIHWMIIYGYEKDYFLCCDPVPEYASETHSYRGKKSIPETKLIKNADTPIGMICVTVNGI